MNFNAAAVAPELRSIRDDSEVMLAEYRRLVPGSEGAVKYIHQLSLNCQKLIKELLIEPTMRDRLNVEFFPGTSRALEIALSRIAKTGTIIVSPYEHPTERKVTSWHSINANLRVHQITFTPQDFDRGWEDQKLRLIEQVRQLSVEGSEAPALLISEVCYATGLVVPIEDLINQIRDESPRGVSNLRIIVDGAHAVGNGHRPRALHVSDLYVFSAHKWLLSPEPCGILISRQSPGMKALPYDAWGNTLPITTSSVRMISGLLASLKLINEVGYEHLWARSNELLRRFLERIEDKFSVVGDNTGLQRTLLISLIPKKGLRWKYDLEGLHEYLRANDAFLNLLSVDKKVPWARISFPHFLDTPEIDKLATILNNAVES